MMDVRILPASYSADRWSAVVVLDGDVITTFDCRHGHHTPVAAAKCVDKTSKAWTSWQTDSHEYPVGKTTDGLVIMEIAKVVGRTTHSVRYTVRIAERCPTCCVSLAEPPTSDDCPIPEDHAR